MKKRSEGFSLIELLIVIVILGILASISVAGLMASKRSANEGSVISSMRILHGAQMTYASTYGGGEFAGDVGIGSLTAFSTLRSFSLVDEVLGSGNKASYNFVGGREVSSSTSPAQFFFSAIPVSSDTVTRTGNHRFGISTDGIIRQDDILFAQYSDISQVTSATAIGN